MRKLIGFVIFCMAAGMLLMLFVTNKLIGIALCGIFFVAGYNLYCC